MAVEIAVRPPFYEDWTRISILGTDEDDVSNVILSRCLTLDFEVQIEDAEGIMVPWEEA